MKQYFFSRKDYGGYDPMVLKEELLKAKAKQMETIKIEKNNGLIGLSGIARSGKNTVAKIINKLLRKPNHYTELGINPPDDYNNNTYEERSFAYFVKRFASELTGVPLSKWETTEDKAALLGHEWDYVDKETGLMTRMTRRKMLQKLGSDACNQNLHPDCWVNGLFKDYTEGSKWIVTDVRFPQEVRKIVSMGGILIRVLKPDLGENREGLMHISETALEGFDGYDYTIVNDGNLTDLEDKVKVVLREIGLL